MVDLVPGTANRAVREVIDGKEVFTPIVSTSGGSGDPVQVEVSNWPALMTAQQGADILAELQAQTALLQTIATNTTPTP